MEVSQSQWSLQEPKLEVPTTYKAYVRPKFQGISPQNIAWNMVQYLHLSDPEISIDRVYSSLLEMEVPPKHPSSEDAVVFSPVNDGAWRVWMVTSSHML